MYSNRQAELILILTTLLAALGWVFSKQAIQGLPPFGFIGFRFLFASLCLLPFCIGALKKASYSDCLKSMGVGVLLSGSIFCWIYAISISDTLGEGAFIMSLSMLLVPLIAWPLFGTKPSRLFWLSLPIALVGLFLLSWTGEWVVSESQIWFMAAAFGLSLHFNFNSRYSAKLTPMLLTTLQLMIGGVLGILLSLSFETWPQHVSVITWQWFTLSVLLATSLRYLMQTAGQKHAIPANAAIIMLLEPLWTLLLSVWIYDESMPFNKIIGCALLLFALLFYRLGHRLK
jgi:drug/metabolite transporter (DMT)-like permease